jgi:hypothetical protein
MLKLWWELLRDIFLQSSQKERTHNSMQARYDVVVNIAVSLDHTVKWIVEPIRKFLYVL